MESTFNGDVTKGSLEDMREVYQAKDHLINGFGIYLFIFYEEAEISS